MENRHVEYPCFFQWNIGNPFVPSETLEATFYSLAGTLTQWKVTIEPIVRHLNVWTFSFSLKGEEFDEFDIILAPRVEIGISLNGEIVEEKCFSNFRFESSNQHTYNFETDVEIKPEYWMPVLAIRVHIYLHGPPIIQPIGIPLYEEDQKRLSEDLNRLFTDARFSNMRLYPNDNLPFHVHSCIVYARWNNFFKIHPSGDIDDIRVETNISRAVLRDILKYMYSGTLGITWPDWINAPYIAELFELIDRYKLYHLYKVFVRSDSEQLRETTKNLVINSCRFDVDDVYGQHLEIPSYYWDVDFHRDYRFDFLINFTTDEVNARLSYSLKSKNAHKIYVLVNIQFVKEITTQGDLREVLVPLHEQDYNIGPDELVVSGEVHFLQDNAIFADFIAGNRRVPGEVTVQHFFRCFLYLSNGTSIMEVKNIHNTPRLNDRERFRDLGDHMYALMTGAIESDAIVELPFGVSRNPLNIEVNYAIHKAIFASRIPKYWRVLRNVHREGDIPAVVTCTLSSEAFFHALLYIYTGKVLAIPLPFMDEVYRFAQQTEFNALLNLINRMRYGEINR